MSSVDPDEVFREWTLAGDGVWTRRAARAIVADVDGRILLLQAADPHEPSRTWWFTPGGGLEGAELERDCAARELFEESGLDVPAGALEGPVAVRDAEFPYFGRRCRQHEVLFYARLDGDSALRTDGWTTVERASVTQITWWPLDELAATHQTVYPPALPEIASALVTSGWDGTTHTIA